MPRQKNVRGGGGAPDANLYERGKLWYNKSITKTRSVLHMNDQMTALAARAEARCRSRFDEIDRGCEGLLRRLQ